MYKISRKNKPFFSKGLKILTIIFALPVFFTTILLSCTKKSNPNYSGDIVSPSDGAIFNYNDTIRLIGFVNCDQSIDYAELALRSDSTTIRIRLYPHSGNYLTFDTTLSLLDGYFSNSSDYEINLDFKSEDFSALVRKKRIHINTIPRTTLKTFFVSGTPNNPSLFELNNAVPTLINSYNFRFLDLKIDNHYRRIYINGKEKAIGLDAKDNTELFQLSPIALNSDSFISSQLFSNLLLLNRNDGNIVFYNANGLRQGETGENLFIRPLFTYGYLAYLFSSFLKNNDRIIALNFFPSGDARQELLVDFDILGFNEISSEEILVAGNKNGHTVIYKYLVDGNTIQLLKNIPNTITTNSFNYYSGGFLLLTNTGLIKYDYPSNSTITVNSGVYSGVNYDEVNDILYCFSGHNITQLQGNSFADLGTQSFPDSIMALSVLYSK